MTPTTHADGYLSFHSMRRPRRAFRLSRDIHLEGLLYGIAFMLAAPLCWFVLCPALHRALFAIFNAVTGMNVEALP